MSAKKHLYSQGFTIVELLIVVVVIGIIASITIVSYSGVARRAHNTARISAASQLVKVFELTKIYVSLSEIQGSLQYDTWYRACIGKGYPDLNNDGTPDCAAYNGSPFVSETTAFNAILASTATIPSMSSYGVVAATNGDSYYGPYLSSIWVDGQPVFSLEYFLEGEKEQCKLSPLIYYTSDSDATLTSQGAPAYTSSGDGITVCKLKVSERVAS